MGLDVDLRATYNAEGADEFVVDAAFDVQRGETLVILGPSGSGKSLLLETIAGFHSHAGRVGFDGRDHTGVPPDQRDFGFVFQDYALFPHMTVHENVEYGTRYHDGTRDAGELVEELGIAHLADRYPPTLSGGEKQRVALARALAIRPQLILLDEPLASLDVPTRQTLRDDLADVLADVTSVYVTHNRTTARAIADRIAVMRDGHLVQTGTPDEIFESPASPMVADFTGANTLDVSTTPTLRDSLNGDLPTSGTVSIRPEAIQLDESEGDVRATVERVVREDATNRVTLSVDGVTLDAFVDRRLSRGDDVWVTFPRERLHVC
ncbi:MAG: ABC-type Fe3+/spermidine/putrescine transport system ATPase subunit [Haloarculaceae archaeon]|jgi:ABC-type Fe3+/spermidine/putrescine transport system ATPase subunit